MVGSSTSDLFVGAVTNNTFTLREVDESLKRVLYHSFNYLDNLQRELVGLYRFSFKTSDLASSKYKQKLILHVNKDLIDNSVRETYRRSQFYNKEITLSTITDNQDTFIRIPIVYIDGKVTFQYTVKALNDITEIHFKYSKELLSHSNITVIFMINDGITTIRTNKYVIRKYEEGLPLSMFTNGKPWDGSFLTCVGDGSSLTGSSFSYGYIKNDLVNFKFTGGASSIITTNGSVDITILRNDYIHTLPNDIETYRKPDGTICATPVIITGGNGERLPCPVPVENIIVSKFDTNSGEFLIHDNISVKRSYPFIYDIIDPDIKDGDLYRLVYFYVPAGKECYYTNYLHNLHRLAVKFASSDGTLLSALINIRNYEHDESHKELYEKYKLIDTYEPHEYKYDFVNFEEDDSHPYHFDYKISKMCEFIKADPWLLMEYVKSQSRCNYGYTLDVSTVNLEARYRLSTEGDVRDKYNIVELSEPCYLFVFNIGSRIDFAISIFVDGIYVIPDCVIDDHFTKYIYIPTRLVDKSSKIVIEKNDSYVYKETTILNDDDIKHIAVKIPSYGKVYPLVHDIDVRDAHNRRVNGFKLTRSIDNVTFDVTEHEYSPAQTFSIQLENTSDYVGIPINIIVDRSNAVYPYESDSDPILVTLIPHRFLDYSKRIRLFLNGRLVDNSVIILSEYDEEHAVLLLRIPLKLGDQVAVDISPAQYRQVYSSDTIPINGIVNFAEALNKPATIAYYDIYVNGRRMNDDNVTQLTPNILSLRGLTSLRNLMIFEKDRDPIEYFGRETYYNSLDKNIENSILSDESIYSDSEKMSLIQWAYEDEGKKYPPKSNSDDENDMNGNIIDDKTVETVLFIFKNIYVLRYINPDKNQLFKSTITDAGDVVSPWMLTDLESEDGEPNVFTFNPDIGIDDPVIVQPISSDKLYTQYKIEIPEES